MWATTECSSFSVIGTVQAFILGRNCGRFAHVRNVEEKALLINHPNFNQIINHFQFINIVGRARISLLELKAALESFS
jgi:hypothetical protein